MKGSGDLVVRGSQEVVYNDPDISNRREMYDLLDSEIYCSGVCM